MSQAIEKFSCKACKRVYAWKKELAGKRMKCRCGQPISVPAAVASPKPAPADEDDLYDLADFAAAEKHAAAKAPPVIVEALIPTARIAPAAAVAASAGAATAAIPLGYRRPPTGREIANGPQLIDMNRDVYAPIALMILGAILYLGYYAFRYSIGPVGMLTTSVGLAIMTVFETALLVAFAFVAAGPLGVSFGGIWTAVLKLAAIAIFCDGATTWVDGLIAKYGGGISGGVFGFGAIGFPVALGIYWSTLIYLFSMDPGDSWMVVVLLSVFYRIMRVVLLLLLLKLILSLGGVAGSAIALPTFGSAPAAVNPQIQWVEEARDHNVLREGREYVGKMSLGVEAVPVNAWYEAGAKNVWFELGKDINGPTSAFQMIVELPQDKTARTKCFDIARAYYEGMKLTVDPTMFQDTGDPYLMVPLPAK
ncbi:MAG: hypothetical protein M3O30_02355 [Planctomycetota bacterium]|nr:hypothetical protein [Planctomycetota bacterium]